MDHSWDKLAAVALGGGLGSVARWLVAGWVEKARPGLLPLGTLAVNVLGCFLLALIVEVTSDRAGISPTLRLGIATGLLGGFTTYSTFNEQTMLLIHAGQGRIAVANLVATVGLGLLAGLLGLAVGAGLGARG
ncbi:fluoride efflux transporter CrcB [Myxococcota bacterium]|nr:fluoride efflux transporter CrcB [Myxococcota bacterium]